MDASVHTPVLRGLTDVDRSVPTPTYPAGTLCSFIWIKGTTISGKGLGLQVTSTFRKVCCLIWRTGFLPEIPDESLPSHDQPCQCFAFLTALSQGREGAGDTTSRDLTPEWTWAGCPLLLWGLQDYAFPLRWSEMDLVLNGLDVRPCGKMNPQMPPTSQRSFTRRLHFV